MDKPKIQIIIPSTKGDAWTHVDKSIGDWVGLVRDHIVNAKITGAADDFEEAWQNALSECDSHLIDDIPLLDHSSFDLKKIRSLLRELYSSEQLESIRKDHADGNDI